ncbi:MAG: hypothetical protein IJI19_02815 [Ruminococcus sp.]|nr:hypothetical protein [Ruminococcus sp.]
MKKFFVLLCAVLMLALSLCACMNTSAGRVDETQAPTTFVKPTERSKGSEALAETKNNDREAPTDDDSEMMETIVDAVATEWDDMVEDGQIEDGDGNVGERENNDGDGNYDPDAVE